MFEETIEREEINSGEKHSIIVGKIKKWLSDLHKVSFTGSYKDLKNKPNLKPIDTENRIENMTSINQITSIGFWTIWEIDADYATSIGIDNNVGDFYAIVSDYNGNGLNSFIFGNLLLFSPRLKGYHYAVDVWNGNARARLVLTNGNILTTKEQINANTNANNIAGAVAMKEMFSEINSNLLNTAEGKLLMSTENDCNNLGIGIYLCNSDVKNIPYSSWWCVLSANVSGTAVQIAYNLGGDKTYRRYCAAGSWSEWTQHTNGFKAIEIDLSYKSATEMFYEFDNDWIKAVSLVIIKHSQTPIEKVTSTLASRIDNKIVCYAYGNGFVNGHILRAKLYYFD